MMGCYTGYTVISDVYNRSEKSIQDNRPHDDIINHAVAIGVMRKFEPTKNGVACLV